MTPFPFRSGGLATVILLGVCRPAPDQGTPAEALARCDLGRAPVERFTMPGPLTELSGLAIGPGGGLLAHADERGRVFEIDPATGVVGRRHVLRGDPRDDFEGIAAKGDSVALMTSTGRLYLFRLAVDSGEVPFTTIETGLGRWCELEGLAWEPRTGVFLLPCKAGRTPATRGGLVVMRYAPGRAADAQPAPVQVPGTVLARAAGTAAIRATAVDLDPVTGHIVVLSSRPPQLLAVDTAGRIVGAARLAAGAHPQAEGLALSPESVYIGDEGAGKRGMISTYACRRMP